MDHRLESPDRRALAITLARSAAVVVAFGVVYFLVPIGERNGTATVVRAAFAVVVLTFVIAVETLAVVRSAQPVRRAVRGLTVIVCLLLVTSATMYLSISEYDPEAFTEPLGHVDALYLSMMTLTTVGFGDIGALSSGARIAVMVQMFFNIVVVGVAAKVMLDRVRRARSGEPTPAAARAARAREV